jgi:flavodoxin
MKTKILLTILLSALLCAVSTACNNHKPKVLIAYYSQSGNTKAVAEQIQARFGGDLFEITPETPYPAGETETIGIVELQRQENILPELTAGVENINDYDVVFLGTPIWFGTASLPVLSFVESHDFAGKTVIPFYTCGGGDAGTYVADITPHLEGATILPAFGNNRAERTAGTHTAKVAAHLEQLKLNGVD